MNVVSPVPPCPPIRRTPPASDGWIAELPPPLVPPLRPDRSIPEPSNSGNADAVSPLAVLSDSVESRPETPGIRVGTSERGPRRSSTEVSREDSTASLCCGRVNSASPLPANAPASPSPSSAPSTTNNPTSRNTSPPALPGLRYAHPRISSNTPAAAKTCSNTEKTAEDSRLRRVKIHVDVNFI
ncbi:MAG: hypothetical protein ACKO2L_08840 [Planctomycetaceae bacterium]